LDAKQPHQPHEKPLSAPARLGLYLLAVAALFVYYAFAIISAGILSGVIALGILLTLAAARFGAGGVIGRLVGVQISLGWQLARNLWPSRRSEFRLQLAETDAPDLFARLRRLGTTMGVKAPHTVGVEMSSGAHIRLGGFFKGTGKTALTLGYDLAAGLSPNETEAVLAHEMAHAKLSQRGFRWWLGSGLTGCAKLTNTLRAHMEERRAVNSDDSLAGLFLLPAHLLTLLIARLFATYSRQDEFEADREAAKVCGAGAMARALSKLERLDQITSRLGWHERVAQLQSEGGVSQWLLEQLKVGRESASSEFRTVLADRYSTHPSIRDRLAALSEFTVNVPISDESSLAWFSNPDGIARRLVAEIQRLTGLEEERETAKLRKEVRGLRLKTHFTPAQGLGVILVLFGTIWALIDWFVAWDWAQAAIFLGLIGVGIFLYRAGRPRLEIELPWPDFTLLAKRRTTPPPLGDPDERNKAIKTDLQTKIGGLKGKKRRQSALIRESFTALEACDYERALAGGQMLLGMDDKGVEGMMLVAISAGAFGHAGQAAQFRWLARTYGWIDAPSMAWGLGWSAMLSASWAEAEAYLDCALRVDGRRPVILIMLALARLRRGKIMCGLPLAREGAAAVPEGKEYVKVLINLQLAAGDVAETERYLSIWKSTLETDADLMLSMVTVKALRRQLDEVMEWAERAAERSPSVPTLVSLGNTLLSARWRPQAERFFREALRFGHCRRS